MEDPKNDNGCQDTFVPASDQYREWFPYPDPTNSVKFLNADQDTLEYSIGYIENDYTSAMGLCIITSEQPTLHIFNEYGKFLGQVWFQTISTLDGKVSTYLRMSGDEKFDTDSASYIPSSLSVSNFDTFGSTMEVMGKTYENVVVISASDTSAGITLYFQKGIGILAIKRLGKFVINVS